MAGSRPWRKWDGILAVTTERDFERIIIPFLKLFWPSLTQAPARKTWDSMGIDLLVWEDEGPFPCVVQCKGFHVQELGNDQIRQSVKSIKDFIESDVICENYIFVHNRDGRNKKFYSEVNLWLERIVSEGKANKAELWDRHTLLKRASKQLKDFLDKALHERSNNLRIQFQNLFRFGKYHLSLVPVIEKRLIFKRGEPCLMKEVNRADSLEISQFMLARANTRWTLLTGRFGSGKTTAVLYTSASSDRVTIFVSCASLQGNIGTSTNEFLEHVVNSLNIFDDFKDQEREIIDKLAGPTLASLLGLGGKDSSHILVLDGLDENRFYSNLKGLQTLSNQLADLECSIIMTTRKEHMNTMFGDFSLAFNEFSTKMGPKREARLLELEPWKKQQVLLLIDQILGDVTDLEKERLNEFVTLMDKEKYVKLYGELPFSPLFLQFILEDIVINGLRHVNRSTLIFSWVKRKIRRDRSIVTRSSPDDLIDVEDFIDRMILLMENVANSMTAKTERDYELLESINSSHVKIEAANLFKTDSDPLLGILLNSVLIPLSVRRGPKLDITFSFRILHEYFLAAYLVRKNLLVDYHSDTIKSFYSEIRSNILEEPDSDFALHFLQ